MIWCDFAAFGWGCPTLHRTTPKNFAVIKGRLSTAGQASKLCRRPAECRYLLVSGVGTESNFRPCDSCEASFHPSAIGCRFTIVPLFYSDSSTSLVASFRHNVRINVPFWRASLHARRELEAVRMLFVPLLTWSSYLRRNEMRAVLRGWNPWAVLRGLRYW